MRISFASAACESMGSAKADASSDASSKRRWVTRVMGFVSWELFRPKRQGPCHALHLSANPHEDGPPWPRQAHAGPKASIESSGERTIREKSLSGKRSATDSRTGACLPDLVRNPRPARAEIAKPLCAISISARAEYRSPLRDLHLRSG